MGHALAFRDDSYDVIAPAAPRRSLLFYSPALVALAVAMLVSTRVADPDLWGHLHFGSVMLHSGRLPATDPYAYSVLNLPWRSHEWLSEVIMACLYGALGVAGLDLVKLGCASATVVFLALAMEETGASTLAQFAILVLAGLRLSLQFQFRPQIFSYALFAALLALLARENYRRTARLWPAIPLFALWANLHGGFVVGLGALGIYAAVRAAEDWRRGEGLATAARLVVLCLGCTLATLATPYGAGTWRTVAHTIFNPRMVGVINEWKPLLAVSAGQLRISGMWLLFDLSLFGTFAALGAVLIKAPRGGDNALVAIALLMIAASFEAVRNVPFGLIAATVPLARHAALGWERPPAGRGQPRATLLNQARVGGAAIGLFISSGLFAPRLPLDERYPAGAFAFMERHGLAGNLLADYGWNDYLIFHGAGADRVFIDSRFETVYPARIQHDFLEFTLGRDGAQHTLDAYPHDYVLTAVKSPSARVMSGARGWTLIYDDAVALLFARVNSPAARIAGVPVRGASLDIGFP